MSDMSVAICLSGAPRSFAHASMQAHWRAVVAPLRDEFTVDIFAHLSTVDSNRSAVEAAAAVIGARTLRLYDDPVGASRWTTPKQRRSAELLPKSCAHDQSLYTTTKWQGCWRDIAASEAARGQRYAFVFRMRPDLEYAASLPGAAQWRCLKPNVALFMEAEWPVVDGSSTWARSTRLRGQLMPAASTHLLIDDNLAVLPRAAADAYFGIADRVARCLPPQPPPGGTRCIPGSWDSLHCQILEALARVPGLAVGELPIAQNFAFVDLPPNGRPKRRGLGTGRRGFEWPQQPFLSARPPPSHFALSHLRSECTGSRRALHRLDPSLVCEQACAAPCAADCAHQHARVLQGVLREKGLPAGGDAVARLCAATCDGLCATKCGAKVTYLKPAWLQESD